MRGACLYGRNPPSIATEGRNKIVLREFLDLALGR